MMNLKPSSEHDRLHRMLLTYVRQEFEAPVGAILGYAEIMLEDAEQQGHDSILGDLQRLRQAGLKLKELVSGLLDPGAMHQNFADFRRNLRHDLRTPISAIKGFGEMLLEDAQDARNEALAHDLEKLLDASARLLAQIDRLVDFTGTSLPSEGKPESAAVSAVLKSVRPLSSVAFGEAESSRILIVDDTEATRELLARRLAREGHHVVEAENGHPRSSVVLPAPDGPTRATSWPGLGGERDVEEDLVGRALVEHRHRLERGQRHLLGRRVAEVDVVEFDGGRAPGDGRRPRASRRSWGGGRAPRRPGRTRRAPS